MSEHNLWHSKWTTWYLRSFFYRPPNVSHSPHHTTLFLSRFFAQGHFDTTSLGIEPSTFRSGATLPTVPLWSSGCQLVCISDQLHLPWPWSSITSIITLVTGSRLARQPYLYRWTLRIVEFVHKRPFERGLKVQHLSSFVSPQTLKPLTKVFKKEKKACLSLLFLSSGVLEPIVCRMCSDAFESLFNNCEE